MIDDVCACCQRKQIEPYFSFTITDSHRLLQKFIPEFLPSTLQNLAISTSDIGSMQRFSCFYFDLVSSPSFDREVFCLVLASIKFSPINLSVAFNASRSLNYPESYGYSLVSISIASVSQTQRLMRYSNISIKSLVPYFLIIAIFSSNLAYISAWMREENFVWLSRHALINFQFFLSGKSWMSLRKSSKARSTLSIKN